MADEVQHPQVEEPSAWVERWADLIAPDGTILDVACGGGRHARWFAVRGYRVDAVDRDAGRIARLMDVRGVTPLCADLEGGGWPYGGRTFDGIVVTNYLHRPLLPLLIEAVAPAGVLIYETFAAGNERFGRPSNPDFLLKPGELLEAVRGALRVIAYEDLVVTAPRPAAVQRICAQRAP